jgi:UDP-N-acetyl-2-amino-2-deoxyglucuronate dehydrogenase
MDSTNKISFGIIGCGHIGKRHAAFIKDNPDCVLMGLCDVKQKNELGIDDFAVPFFKNADDLLLQRFDVVCIATPNGLHAQQAIYAIQSGHHVVIEKPMALTKMDCEKIIEEAQLYNKHIFCVAQNRYSLSSQWLKNSVEKNLLGKIFFVSVNCFWNRDERYYQQAKWRGTKDLDGGTLFSQFSHFIDSLLWIFGDIKNIRAKLRNFSHSYLDGFDDAGNVSFDFVNSGIGNINFSTAVWKQNLESSITVIGENGTIKISGQYMEEVTICDIKDYTMPQLSAGALQTGYKGNVTNHHYFFENVVDVLNGKKEITVQPVESLNVVDVIEKIYKAGNNS